VSDTTMTQSFVGVGCSLVIVCPLTRNFQRVGRHRH
jgi:hypothetical protein